jgi:hypothetical protein
MTHAETNRELYWVVKDPARPLWPGLLIVGPGDAFMQIVAGSPHNFASSETLANRIAAALNQTAIQENGE